MAAIQGWPLSEVPLYSFLTLNRTVIVVVVEFTNSTSVGAAIGA